MKRALIVLGLTPFIALGVAIGVMWIGFMVGIAGVTEWIDERFS